MRRAGGAGKGQRAAMQGGSGMRILSVVLLVLAAGLCVVWATAYVWINGLACGYALNTDGCSIKPPWALRGEDFLLLVALPAAGVGVLLAGGLAAWRRSRHR
jgi:hypothetical protein